MKRIYFLFIAVCYSSAILGQLWTQVGEKEIGGGVRGLCYDSINDRLFAFGEVKIYNQGQGNPIGMHTVLEFINNNWDTIDVRSPSFIGGLIYDMVYFKNKYYITGSFHEIGSSNDKNFAEYFNGQWNPMSNKLDSYAYKFKVVDDTLIIGGVFRGNGTVNSPGVIKFDGTDYHGFDPLEAPVGLPPRVKDLEIYNGNLIVCGRLQESNASGKNNIVEYHNGKKRLLKNWRVNDFAEVFTMAVYKDELYVGGYFYKSDGISLGNNIVKWNGEEWTELGTGCNSSVNLLTVYNDELIVGGFFTECGGVQAHSLAKWDGEKWCNFTTDTFNHNIIDIALYKDSLYIAGYYTNLGADSVSHLARWSGGDYSEDCGEIHPIGISNPYESRSELVVSPNPSNGTFRINQYEGNQAEIELFNLIGKSVWKRTLDDVSKDISIPANIVNGTYIIRVRSSDNFYSGKIVLIRD